MSYVRAAVYTDTWTCDNCGRSETVVLGNFGEGWAYVKSPDPEAPSGWYERVAGTAGEMACSRACAVALFEKALDDPDRAFALTVGT